MKIRTRLTLWYAAILFISMLLVAGVGYKHFLSERTERGSSSLSEFFHSASEDPDDLLAVVLWFGLPTAFIAVAGGWWLMRKAFGPIQHLTETAERITAHNLGEELPRTGNGDELDRLAEVLNGMTKRLDHSFQQIRDFTLHASHELKTPLTVMRAETEIALADEKLSSPERERLLSQLDELQRLAKIVDGLTLLTKADAGQLRLDLEKVRLDELIRDSFEDARVLAEPQRISVTLQNIEPLTLCADRHRLRQLLLNLTDNAIKYNQRCGVVTMSLRKAGDEAVIQIANSSAGIAPDDLPRVFERFFRAEKSHNNAIDGCGLGLSIVQWIVRAHGGTIRIDSDMGNLTTVIVHLPLAGK